MCDDILPTLRHLFLHLLFWNKFFFCYDSMPLELACISLCLIIYMSWLFLSVVGMRPSIEPSVFQTPSFNKRIGNVLIPIQWILHLYTHKIYSFALSLDSFVIWMNFSFQRLIIFRCLRVMYSKYAREWHCKADVYRKVLLMYTEKSLMYAEKSCHKKGPLFGMMYAEKTFLTIVIIWYLFSMQIS